MNFRKVNNITGWVVFLIAAVTYILTREATASFWDCGEFISCADKMEIPHPPGSPLFNMMGRLFIVILSGGHAENAASSVNMLSALSSAFAILFLFWTITHFARKMFVKPGDDLTSQQTVAVMISGVIGALAYTFSDTFWFSAVEGEVYAFSSFFTALIFWAILKWEHADELAGTTEQKTRVDRWIVFVFFMVGLAVTVHLLNLLTIPAIVMIYYYRRYSFTVKGGVTALISSIIITGLSLWLFIYFLPRTAATFDRVFVNSFSLPLFSGFAFFFALLGFLAWLGIKWATRKGYSLLNLSIWSFLFMLLGFSTYVTTLIRSNANPVIDMANVDNPMSLASYFGRDQYGSAPLIYGPTFAAQPIDIKEGRMQYQYDKAKKEYVETGRAFDYKYNDEDMMFFPRIWDASNEQNHAGFYADWLGLERYRNQQTGQISYETPGYGDNMNWFISYQNGFMYWRYFMWNFSGRQNDIQGFGNKRDGNWVTGIPIIDNFRLGDQSQLPDSLKKNKANNKLFLLPFLLGIIGCAFQYLNNRKDWLVNFLLFFFTGLAIVLYLNQPGNQPRERDYAYVGSFYVYAIWIGLAVTSLYKLVKSDKKEDFTNVLMYGSALTFILSLFSSVPGPGGAVLVTSVLITAVYALLLSLLNFLLKAVSAKGSNEKMINIVTGVVCLVVPLIMANQEWDDHDRGKKTLARDSAINYLESCAPNAILFTFGDNDTYPLWYAQEVEGVRPDIRIINNSLLGIDWYINQLRRAVNETGPIDVIYSEDDIRGNTRNYLQFRPETNQSVFNDLETVLKGLKQAQYERTYPVRRFRVPIDKEMAVKSGLFTPSDSIPGEMLFEIPEGKGIQKNELIMLAVIATNKWQRPIYFTSPGSNLGFDQYLYKEGLTYRLIPRFSSSVHSSWAVDNILKQKDDIQNADSMYNHLMNKFRPGSADIKGVYFDETNRGSLLSTRNAYSDLAGTLADNGRKEEAQQLLQKCESMMLTENFPYAMPGRFHNQNSIVYLEACYKAGLPDLAEKVRQALVTDMKQQQDYYTYLKDSKPELYSSLVNEENLNRQLREILDMVIQKYAPEKLEKPVTSPLPPVQQLPSAADSIEKDS